MIYKMLTDCEGMVQEFSEIINYFKHLKDYVNYISKDVFYFYFIFHYDFEQESSDRKN